MSDDSESTTFLFENSLFSIGVALSVSVYLLYAISPDDPSAGIPSPFASRYLWTPIIPLFIGLSVSSLALAGFRKKLSDSQIIISGCLIFTSILLSPQFAELTPIESDGWWFVEMSMRYSEYGNDGTEGYLSRMLFLMPLDILSKFSLSSLPIAASLLGLFFYLGWLFFCIREISHFPQSSDYSIPMLTFFSLLMLSWWNPTPYSGQMLSLMMMALLLYLTPGREIHPFLYYSVAALLPATHLQTPIILCFILFFEASLSNARSRTSLLTGLVLGLSFFIWNFTIAEVSFRHQFPDSTPFPVSPEFLIPCLLIAFFIAYCINKYVYREAESRLKQAFSNINNLLGTSNVSVLLGCIVSAPIVIYADFRMNAARLTPRLFVYCFVPFTIWTIRGTQFLMRTLRDNKHTKEKFSTIIISISILCGSLASVAHTNYASRTYMIPSESIDCWDMTEEVGIVGLMSYNSGEPNYVLHSHLFLSQADWEGFWYFYRLGDESRIVGKDPQYISAVLETSDLDDEDFLDNGLNPNIFENWTLAGEVNGACRLWVHPDDVQHLDRDLFWDRR